jgi:hypothetical protein
MAKQADTFGFDTGQTWAFGRGTRPVASQPVPVDNGNGFTARRSEYEQPAVFPSGDQTGRSEYEHPAVFPSGDQTGRSEYEHPAVFPSGDQTAAHRNMWDQLPPDRRRRGARYVGKHRA